MVRVLGHLRMEPLLERGNISVVNASAWLDVQHYISDKLGPQRLEYDMIIPLSVIYVVVFICGIIGNVLTCIVIIRNSYMHTTTNYYLFSLAVSDIMMLLFGKCHACPLRV